MKEVSVKLQPSQKLLHHDITIAIVSNHKKSTEIRHH